MITLIMSLVVLIMSLVTLLNVICYLNSYLNNVIGCLNVIDYLLPELKN